MEKKLKLCIGAFISTVGIISYYNYDYKYEPEYEIINEDAYAKYRNGYIYIGDKAYLDSVDAKENDICILDDRCSTEPNMKIYNSYRITDKDVRNDILCVMLEYDKMMHSDNWNRSIESMRLEWLVHNVCYDLDIETDRTVDVDFTFDEEEKYDKEVLRKILKL